MKYFYKNLKIFFFSSQTPQLQMRANRLPNRTVLGHLSGYMPLDFLDREPIKLPRAEPVRVDLIDLGGHVRSCCGLVELYGWPHNHTLAMTDYSSFTIKVLGKCDSHELVDLTRHEIDMFRAVKFKNLYALCTDYDETSLLSQRPQMNLFVCDMDLNRVLIYDLTIRKLKKIITGFFRLYVCLESQDLSFSNFGDISKASKRAPL